MRSSKYYSGIQENTIAKSLDWSVVTGSGARSTFPGDVESDMWLGECKTHTSPNHNITFNYTVWNKIDKEATSKFKYPVLFVDDGSQSLNKTWCMIPANVRGISMDIYPYPYKFRNNISFNSDKLSSYMQSLSICDNVAFMTKFHEYNVFILRFDSFISLFGSNLC